ncbi:MAG: hypothetical protein ACJ8BW_08495 [Ktedonobacteraceae bacterium]
MAEQLSFVSACKNYFEKGKHGRKVEIAEFKALSTEDRVELRDLLIEEGFDVRELGVPAP